MSAETGRRRPLESRQLAAAHCSRHAPRGEFLQPHAERGDYFSESRLPACLIFDRFTLLPLAISLLAFLPTPAPAESIFKWTNGNTLNGEILEASERDITLQSPFFTGPVTVGLHALRRVESTGPDKKPADPCSIRLRDGSRIYGDVIAMDAASLTLRSKRHGEIILDRAGVASVRRLSGGRLKFAGPTSGAGWTEVKGRFNEKVPALWREAAGGVLTQVGWERSSFLPLNLDERTEIEIELSSSARPEFKLELISEKRDRLLIETWDDELVLQGRKFVSLRKFSADDRSVSLRLFWDCETGTCAVFLATGEKLAETDKNAVGASKTNTDGVKPGLVLHNKGPFITLDKLHIRAWKGDLPQDVSTLRPRIVLLDGSVIAGEILRSDGETLTTRARAGGRAEKNHRWKQVEIVEFAAEPFEDTSLPNTELWFSDGAWIAGTLQSIADGRVALRTSFSREPLLSSLDGLRRLELRVPPPPGTEPEPPPLKLDKLTTGNKILRGTLENAANGLRWKPVGAAKSVEIAPAPSLEVIRGVREDAVLERAPALFFLKSGDIVPGDLRAIDDARVALQSGVIEKTELPVSELRAIQFFDTRVNLEGLEDPGWRQVRGNERSIERDGGKLTIQPGGAYGHPAILQGDQLKFSFGGDRYSYGGLLVRLFCNGLDANSPSTNVVFFRYSNEIVFGLQTNGDQIDRQSRLSVNSNKPVPIRFGLGEKQLDVFINNVSVRKIPLDEKMRSGIGLILEPGSVWGNDKRGVVLNNISVRAAPGITSVPAVDADAREHALMVPRFRKEDPPRHVLLAANGDLLRGVIEAATANHFSVRSGFENIRVPRERVAAAVWLEKPTAQKTADEPENTEVAEKKNRSLGGTITIVTGAGKKAIVDETGIIRFAGEPAPAKTPAARSVSPTRGVTHWLLLASGARLALAVDKYGPEFITGDHPLLGRCRVPVDDVHIIRTSAPAPSLAMERFSDWKLVYAPEPVLPETGGQSSPLLGKAAPDFKLNALDGASYDLASSRGKVVVLDFWATWCGPCIKALPEYIEALADFDPERVRFLGVNQAEGADQVKRFLETRGWEMEVLLDAQQRVGQSYGVEGIPHTVIVGPDGNVAWVHTGYDPGSAAAAAAKVRELLEAAEK